MVNEHLSTKIAQYGRKRILLQKSHFVLSVAWRYTTGSKNLGFSRMINRMAMIGLILGVTLLILVLSVMNGFDRELRQRILAVIPHITLFADKPIDWQYWQPIIEQQDGVIYATPYSEQLAMAIRGELVESIMLYAIDSQLELRNIALSNIVGVSTLQKLSTPGTIALGSLIAQRLNLQTGDTITLLTNGRYRQFTVASILKTGTELDNIIAMTHLNSLHPTQAQADGIRIMSNDLFATYSLALALLELLPVEFRALTWAQTQGTLYEAIQTSRNIVFIMVFLLLAIAAFNILSSLMILSAEKRQDIAILKTIGVSQFQLFQIFCLQGMIIGILGTSIGLVAGLILADNISAIIYFIENVFHIKFLTTDIYPIDFLPSDIQAAQVAFIAIIALALSTFAAIIPAWKAMKVEPAESLRHD